MLRNGSLWADIFLTKDGASPNPQNPEFEPANIHHVRKRELVVQFFMIDTLTFVSVDPIPRPHQGSKGKELAEWLRCPGCRRT